jgi:hypothetical protein
MSAAEFRPVTSSPNHSSMSATPTASMSRQRIDSAMRTGGKRILCTTRVSARMVAHTTQRLPMLDGRHPTRPVDRN